MNTTRFAALFLLLASITACGVEPLPGEDDAAYTTRGAPAPMPPDETPLCVTELTDGQSAVMTDCECTVIGAGDGLDVTGCKVLKAWAGPHAMLCWGPSVDSPDACAGNTALSPTTVDLRYTHPVVFTTELDAN